MLLNRTGGGGENVTPQVDTYSSLLERAITEMAGKVYLPPVLEGEYVWKKLTTEGGDFVDYVVSDNPTAYPDGGEQDGYWYELFEDSSGVEYGFITNPSQTTSIVVEHSLGVVPRHSILVALKTATTSKTVVATDLFSAYFSGFYNADYAVADEKTITFNSRNASYPFDAMEFIWIAVA